MTPKDMTAAEAAAAIRAGTLTSETLVRDCLDRIADRDPEVRAWLHVDETAALAWAREMDKRKPMGPLHGLPFGVKDMIDTADMPTSQNSEIFQGHQPARDAASVAVMRANGAVLLGKTDTVEFAAPGRVAATRNPANLDHTPGGSSSGSAAAVADHQVPLAIGTQTGGSHIRPGSFNGLHALKPTWGVVSREGAKQYACSLDTIGFYGRSVADLELVAEAFRLYGAGSVTPPEVKGLRIGLCKSPVWSYIEPEGEAALMHAAKLYEEAGAIIEEFEFPEHWNDLFEATEVVRRGEGRANFLDLYLTERERLNPEFVDHCEANRGITVPDLIAANDLVDACRVEFGKLYAGFDALLTPASPGAAPKGLASTGNHAFNSIWTALHVPCLGMPSIVTDAGLPVGIQLIKPRYADSELLALGGALPALV